MAAGAGLAMAVFAAPAYAAPGDTTTTFSLTSGGLGITVPASQGLGSAVMGSATITAQLGTVTVDDLRGGTAGWVASVTSSDFTRTPAGTIAKANADYWSGTATSSSGTATFTPGEVATGDKVALASAQTAFTATAVTGDNTVAWNPTVVINVPAGVLAGAYSGTINHSVA
jgi:hypothetical protein